MENLSLSRVPPCGLSCTTTQRDKTSRSRRQESWEHGIVPRIAGKRVSPATNFFNSLLDPAPRVASTPVAFQHVYAADDTLIIHACCAARTGG